MNLKWVHMLNVNTLPTVSVLKSTDTFFQISDLCTTPYNLEVWTSIGNKFIPDSDQFQTNLEENIYYGFDFLLLIIFRPNEMVGSAKLRVQGLGFSDTIRHLQLGYNQKWRP